MKIALYYPWIHLKSGVERTILETVKRSKHQITIFTNHFDKENTYPEFKKLKVLELKKIPVRRNIFSTFVAATIIASQKIDLSSFNKLLIHSEGLGDLFLIRNNFLQTICFCHTPLRPVFDVEYKKRAMAQRSYIQKQIYKIFNYLFIQIDRLLWKKYTYIFFNSRETLNRAQKGGLVTKDAKYQILHPGVDWENINPSWIYQKYFLVPGRIMWTKNIELAIKAFQEFNKKNTTFKLIIAGQVDKKSESYLKELRRISLNSKNIIFIINPSDKKMHKLYSECYSCIFPAFNEDWGITLLEAASFAKPVIAVNSGGFKESVVNNSTGYLVQNNVKSISNKIQLLSKNIFKTKKMGKSGYLFSKQFDWSIFEYKFDKILNE